MKSNLAEDLDLSTNELLGVVDIALSRAADWLIKSQKSDGSWPSGFGDVYPVASTAVAAFAARRLKLPEEQIQAAIDYIKAADDMTARLSVLDLTDVIHWGGKLGGGATEATRLYVEELCHRDWTSLSPQEGANLVRASCYADELAANENIRHVGSIYYSFIDSLQPHHSSKLALDQSILPVASIMWTFGELAVAASSRLMNILPASGRDLRHTIGRLAGFAYGMQRENGAIHLPHDHDVDASACLALGFLLCGETVYCEQLISIIQFLVNAELDSGGWGADSSYNSATPFVSYYTILALNEYRRRSIMDVNPIFRARGVSRDKSLCFVLMPFGPAWSRELYDNYIAPSARSTDLKPLRADDINSITGIMESVWESILKARVVIADLTGRNPNVMYEVGIAHTIGRPVILLTQDIEDVPFDLRALRCIIYSTALGGPKVLEGNIASTIRQILASE